MLGKNEGWKGNSEVMNEWKGKGIEKRSEAKRKAREEER